MAVPPRGTLVFSVRGPIARTDLPGLCTRVCGLLARDRPRLALCDVATVEPDAVAVEALGRLQLAALRYGCRVRLEGASRELRELVAFMGLSEVFALPPGDQAERLSS